VDKKLLIRKIEFVIAELVFAKSYQKNKSANHFVALKKRVLEGKKLTKKMQENLAWIDKHVVPEEGAL
jgi:hypothetical protein